MMAMDHKNPKTQRFALKTLANISADKDVRGYIGVFFRINFDLVTVIRDM
jgi:hypothetical protein